MSRRERSTCGGSAGVAGGLRDRTVANTGCDLWSSGRGSGLLRLVLCRGFLLGDLLAVVIANDPRYVGLGFVIRWDPVIFIDALWPGVVCSQSFHRIIVVLFQ